MRPDQGNEKGIWKIILRTHACSVHIYYIPHTLTFEITRIYFFFPDGNGGTWGRGGIQGDEQFRLFWLFQNNKGRKTRFFFLLIFHALLVLLLFDIATDVVALLLFLLMLLVALSSFPLRFSPALPGLATPGRV